jgi:hypothetical protein
VNDKQNRHAVQGEGDYRSARRHRRDLEQFVAKNDIEALARDAAPKSDLEHREMLAAEQKGRARIKGRKPGRGKGTTT